MVHEITDRGETFQQWINTFHSKVKKRMPSWKSEFKACTSKEIAFLTRDMKKKKKSRGRITWNQNYMLHIFHTKPVSDSGKTGKKFPGIMQERGKIPFSTVIFSDKRNAPSKYINISHFQRRTILKHPSPEFSFSAGAFNFSDVYWVFYGPVNGIWGRDFFFFRNKRELVTCKASGVWKPEVSGGIGSLIRTVDRS